MRVKFETMNSPTYPYAYLPKPLSPSTFYILLAVSRSPLYAYAIKGAILNSSLGSVRLDDGGVSRAVATMHNEGLLDLAGMLPAGKSGRLRRHYQISEYGKARLAEEFNRMEHALKIAEATGVRDREELNELTRILLERAATGRS